MALLVRQSAHGSLLKPTIDEDSTLYAMNEVIAREKVAVKQAFHKVVDEE